MAIIRFQALLRVLLLSCFSLLLASCGVLDYFSRDDGAAEPSELVDFEPEVELRRLWSTNVGDGQGDKFNRLKPVLSAEHIFVAAYNGEVNALTREDGDRVWRQRLRLPLSGGVGYSNGLVLVGTENSQVIALDAETGDIRWEAEVSSEVLATPVGNGRVVVVQTVDGKLLGLDAESGNRLWVYENVVPALSLRGTSSPLIVDNFVIAAFGNGTVVSVALDNGTLRWDERVSIPTGRSEIDRLVDIDGDLILSDNRQVLVTGYQGYVAAIDVVTGQTRWRVDESSFVGAGSGFGNVYVVTEEDVLRAYRPGQNNTVWENDQLRLRRLTAPQSFSNYVAVGDFAGYVHLLAQSDGRMLARARADRRGIQGRLVSRGNTLYVYGNSGKLVAFQIQ